MLSRRNKIANKVYDEFFKPLILIHALEPKVHPYLVHLSISYYRKIKRRASQFILLGAISNNEQKLQKEKVKLSRQYMYTSEIVQSYFVLF